MTTITLDPRQFLNPTRVEGLVNTKLEDDLQVVKMFNTIPTTETNVSYVEDLVTAGADYDAGVTGKPLDLGELSQLTEIEVSPVTMKAGMLQPFGFRIAVSRRALRNNTIIDDLKRAVDHGTYVMARKMDDDLIAKLEAVSNDITEVSGAAVWSADGADVATDIISFQEAFDVSGYNTQLTDLIVEKVNFYEAKKFYSGMLMGVSGSPSLVGDMRTIDTGMGTRIHKAISASIAHGGYIGLDTRPGFQAITNYAYRDPKYGNSAEFPLVNVFQYEEQGYPHRLITEFVADLFSAIKQPYSACYKSSGI